MRSYYDAGIPSSDNAFDESFQNLFNRVIKGEAWKKAKTAIESSILDGLLECCLFFEKDTIVEAQELETVLIHLGYRVHSKNAQDGCRKILIINWNKDYDKRV